MSLPSLALVQSAVHPYPVRVDSRCPVILLIKRDAPPRPFTPKGGRRLLELACYSMPEGHDSTPALALTALSRIP
jgi:hypothetical protein